MKKNKSSRGLINQAPTYTKSVEEIMQITQLKLRVNKIKDKFNIKKGRYENLVQTTDKVLREKLKITSDNDIFLQARLLLSESSKYAKEQIKYQLESLVTHGLQYVFGEDKRFEIEIIESKNKTEAEFYVVSQLDNFEIKNKPQEARGGGVVDIVSLILKVAILQSYSPQIEGPLILDEPAKHVSDEYIEKVGEFIQQITQYFGRQVIMVTHNLHLSEIAQSKYEVSQENGISKVVKI